MKLLFLRLLALESYIGIYTNKAVRGIGEIICIVDVEYQ